MFFELFYDNLFTEILNFCFAHFVCFKYITDFLKKKFFVLKPDESLILEPVLVTSVIRSC